MYYFHLFNNECEFIKLFVCFVYICKNKQMMKLYSAALLFCALFIFGQKPIANFTAQQSGSSITFNDASSGSPQIFLWEFPNGSPSTSNIANPVILFSGTAPYQAKLTVSNSNGSSTLIKTISNSSGNVVDLSTGRNDDGSLMNPNAIADNDWSVTNASSVTSVPNTRITYSGATENRYIQMANILSS